MKAVGVFSESIDNAMDRPLARKAGMFCSNSPSQKLQFSAFTA
jgi:hypothetical protein